MHTCYAKLVCGKTMQFIGTDKNKYCALNLFCGYIFGKVEAGPIFKLWWLESGPLRNRGGDKYESLKWLL